MPNKGFTQLAPKLIDYRPFLRREKKSYPSTYLPEALSTSFPLMGGQSQ